MISLIDHEKLDLKNPLFRDINYIIESMSLFNKGGTLGKPKSGRDPPAREQQEVK